MIGSLLLLLQIAAAVPPALIVRTATHTDTVPVVASAATPALSAVKLTAALGGTLKSSHNGHYTIVLGESHIDLTDGDPFVRIDTSIVPLTSAPTIMDGVLYIPFQFATEVIPQFITGFIYDADAAEMRSFNTSARHVATVEPAPVPVASAPPTAFSLPDTTTLSERSPVGAGRPDEPFTQLKHRHVVVVDAGHGGVDNGMTGPIGAGPKIYEKNITLAVAKLVSANLRASGADVIMTRTTDTLIALSDRGRIANRSHGDIFVSIHVNATGSRGRDAVHERGYETYFLAEAKTEDARRVERMENEAVRFETGANAPKGDPLDFILHDMAQNEHLRESDELAQFVQNGFHSFHPGPDRGVQQANFAVLRGSYMPAVLIEIGFGTNPNEAKFISDQDNQHTIARSITKSVVEYLDRYDARTHSGTGR